MNENSVRERSTETIAALLIIDVQVGLLRLIPMEIQSTVLPKIETLLFKARASGTPVIYIRHDGPRGHPLDSEMKGSEIHPSVAPLKGDQIVRKRAADSFFDTTLQEELAKRGIRHLIITGGMTEYCVDSICRRATSLGYGVTLVADAHLTRDSPLEER